MRYTIGSCDARRATNHRKLENAVIALGVRMLAGERGIEWTVERASTENTRWRLGEGFSGPRAVECADLLRRLCGVEAAAVYEPCRVCGVVVTTADNCKHGGLERCGDCGAATCGEHRGADGDVKAARCGVCVERNARLAAVTAALKVAREAEATAPAPTPLPSPFPFTSPRVYAPALLDPTTILITALGEASVWGTSILVNALYYLQCGDYPACRYAVARLGGMPASVFAHSGNIAGGAR